MEILQDTTVSWTGEKKSLPAAVPDAPASARYSIEQLLGAGGMGAVYAAYDRELKRRVALKVLRPESRTGSADEALQREAQAMARLSHPNVVGVYDVGRLEDGRVFVAMELVEGTSLRKWLSVPRPPREILGKFLDAGRGLAAAHQAGLIHRDFKPDNVLVADNGAVRVADFGLARTRGAAEGDRAGTPRYMSPEQLEGSAADERSDQFAYCVALYQALYGEHPFPEKSLKDGPLKPARKPLAWTWPILERGLAARPEDRHPSMGALIAALENDPWRRRRRQAVLVVALLAIAAAGVRLASPASPCAGQERMLAGAWDGARKDAVRRSLSATSAALGPDVFSHLEPVLDRYARGLVSAQTDACEATRVRGEQSEALLDKRTACLQGWRARLEALTALLSSPPVALDKVTPAAFALPDVRACADVRALLSGVEPPASAEAAARVAPGREAVAQAMALIDLGNAREAREKAGEALAIARKERYEPLEAEALLALGTAQSDLRENAEAVTNLESAALTGEASRDDSVVARARVKLVYTVGFQMADPGGRSREGPRADAALRRLGDPPEERARLLNNFAAIEATIGDSARALELRREALRRAEPYLGSDHPLVALLMGQAGADLHRLGRDDEARAMQERGLVTQERLYGKLHPLVATSAMNLGSTLRALGRFDDALAAQQRALSIREQVFGADSTDAAMVLNNLANLYEDMGRYQDGADAIRRALRNYAAHGMEQHPYSAIGEGNLGNLLDDQDLREEALQHHRRSLELYRAQPDPATPYACKAQLWVACDLVLLGRPREAQPEYEEAIGGLERKLGPVHPEIAFAHYQYAEALRQRGQLARALALHRKALDVREKMPSPSRLHLGISHAAIAEVLLQMKQESAALTELELAGPLIESAQDAPSDLGAYRFTRARTLAALGRGGEGRQSAQAALEAVAKLPADADRFRRRVREWLAAN
jgi:tetratricopeptide (TPR) repeat protein/tRNA A-37 threonylcarbamoyl transferase component Bud32